MEQVTIWYITDNNKGERVRDAIDSLGLSVRLIKGFDPANINIVDNEINFFIFDLYDTGITEIFNGIKNDQRLFGSIKFVLLSKKEIKHASGISVNMLRLELISRPVNIREFLLLIEKSILVERYREIMKYISRESKQRIETYEGLMDINRKKSIFSSEKELETFEKIISYEKNLLKEQAKLNKAIRDFTLLRQSELFDMRSRIDAEEMLSDLRRKELLDAWNTIEAQESVLNFSAKELDVAHKIINASENVQELSRKEAIDLHRELKRYSDLNKKLYNEINELQKEKERLLAENDALRKKSEK